MKFKRVLKVCLIVCVFTVFMRAQPDENIPITLQRLSERVLILSETLMSNNVVAVASERGIVVVDTSGLPSIAAKMRRIIEKEFGRSDFAYIINTHSHWDHSFGNQIFPNAVIIGHDNVIPGMAQDEDIIPRRIANLEQMFQNETTRLKGIAAGSEEARNIQAYLKTLEREIHDLKNVFVSAPPQITFNDRMILDLGDITVKLDYFGRAHSTSSIFIHVPEEGILMTGDLFLDQRWVPLFAGQPVLDIDRWIEVLHRALDGDDAPSKVIPGHMDIWEAEKLALWRDYIKTLWEGLKSAKEQGLSFEQAKEQFPLPDPYYYLRERGHSEERIRTFHENNIEAFWRQLFISAADIIEEILTENGFEGIEVAKIKLKELKKQPDKYFVSERQFNSLGYRLLQENRLPHALTVFRMNVETFPQSANVYDSLAEAYLYWGDKYNTIQYYKKSLELNPQNENARSRLERMDELFEEYHPTTPEDALFAAGEQTGLKGPYLGQTPPGNIPVKFPFDYMPQGYKLHSAPAFTPDGKEVYFSAMDFSIRFSEKIFLMKMIGGTWTPPLVASFSGDYFDGSPSISRDGKYLFFSSARTLDGKRMTETGERNIWYVERMGENWSSPRPLNFRTPGWENGSDISELGNLFFDSSDIYKIEFPPKGEHVAEKLGNAINSDATELHPCVAPDERFLVFYSSRPGHYGTSGGDLYISFKNKDGTWKQAVNLGEQFNKGHLSTSFPRLSADGKYFFFLKLTSVPWQAEVFWVSVDALDDLNK